jgi:hypothetical protein
MGLGRKWSDRDQNDTIDPEQTLAARSHGGHACSPAPETAAEGLQGI